jgi:hypothetical protein
LALLIFAGCTGPTTPQPPFVDFIIDVAGERFVARVTDPDAIRLAEANLDRQNNRFPIGTLKSGNGGFNTPWTWHLDPDSVRFVEVAIELCDGRPSYVELHQSDYASYCPWGARVVSRISLECHRLLTIW